MTQFELHNNTYFGFTYPAYELKCAIVQSLQEPATVYYNETTYTYL